MVAKPSDMPKTVPPEVTTAISGSVLLQEPPPTSLKFMDVPTHTGTFQAIGSGSGLTVTTAEMEQPVGNV